MVDAEEVIVAVARAHQEGAATVLAALWRLSRGNAGACTGDPALVRYLAALVRSSRHQAILEPAIGILANMFCAENAAETFGDEIIEAISSMAAPRSPSFADLTATMLRNMFLDRAVCARALRNESFVLFLISLRDNSSADSRVSDLIAIIGRAAAGADDFCRCQFRRLITRQAVANDGDLQDGR